MNSCNFTGRLTKDVELRKTTNGKDMAYFSLAIQDNFNREQANFLNYQVFGKTAEYVSKYGKKGMYVEISSAEATSYTKDKVSYVSFKTNAVKIIFANSKKEETQEENNSNNNNDKDDRPF